MSAEDSASIDFPSILSLCRISAAIGLQDESLLKEELANALESGIPVTLIREAILQSYLFAGYPAAINAFIILNQMVPAGEFLQERGITPDEIRERGTKLCRQIYGKNYEKLVHNMKCLHPDLAEWMLVEGYGRVLSRPFLSPRIRELMIVGMTAVLNAERQFQSHARGALHVGADAQELRRVFQELSSFMKSEVESRLTSVLEKILAQRE